MILGKHIPSFSLFGFVVWCAAATKTTEKEARYQRKKRGGNKRIKYVEGWVEYMDKNIAESVALTLNATPVGKQLPLPAFFVNSK